MLVLCTVPAEAPGLLVCQAEGFFSCMPPHSMWRFQRHGKNNQPPALCLLSRYLLKISGNLHQGWTAVSTL